MISRRAQIASIYGADVLAAAELVDQTRDSRIAEMLDAATFQTDAYARYCAASAVSAAAQHAISMLAEMAEIVEPGDGYNRLLKRISDRSKALYDLVEALRLSPQVLALGKAA
jgi:hypothetical protein